MIQRTLGLTLALGLLVNSVSCREEPSPFSKLFALHVDSMSRDTFVVRWGRDKTIGDALPEDMLLRLPDSAVVMVANVLVASFRQVEPAQCAAFVRGSTSGRPDLMALADRVDSMTAAQWVSVMHQLMLTGMNTLPRGRVIPMDSVVEQIGHLVDRLPADERRRVQAAMLAEQPSDADDCFRGQHVFRQLANMAPGQAGPLFRAVASRGLPR